MHEDRLPPVLGITPSVDELPVLIVGIVRHIEDRPRVVDDLGGRKTRPLGVSNDGSELTYRERASARLCQCSRMSLEESALLGDRRGRMIPARTDSRPARLPLSSPMSRVRRSLLNELGGEVYTGALADHRAVIRAGVCPARRCRGGHAGRRLLLCVPYRSGRPRCGFRVHGSARFERTDPRSGRRSHGHALHGRGGLCRS